MNSLERMRLTLNHQEADHVPYDLAGTTVTSISGLSFERIMDYRGMSGWYDPEEVVDVVQQIIVPPEQTLQQLEVDVRRVGAKRVADYPECVSCAGAAESFVDAYKCSWEMVRGKDFYFNQTSYPLSDYDMLEDCTDKLVLPDLSYKRDEMYRLFDKQVGKSEGTALIADRICAGLTEMLQRLRGYENGYMDLAEDPDAAREAFARLAEHKMQYWDIVGDYIIERGLQDRFLVVAECDDLGTQQSTLVSPAMLRELVFPEMKRYIGFIKKKMPWVKVFFHSCGAIMPVITDMIDCGVDILNPLQYSAKGMDLAELKREFGKELIFWGGGVDTQSILSRGTPQEVADEVRRILDVLAPGGGYVFVPVHNIQQEVPAENYWAMWQTWKDYGKY